MRERAAFVRLQVAKVRAPPVIAARRCTTLRELHADGRVCDLLILREQ
jgi:hypothetical protein